MSRILMILFPEKENDTKHICYSGGCALFSKEFDGLCHQLWSTPPHHLNGKMASMCNFYDTMNPTIVEADNMDISEAITRVEGCDKNECEKELERIENEYHGLDSLSCNDVRLIARHFYERGYSFGRCVGEKCEAERFYNPNQNNNDGVEKKNK